MMRFLRMGWLFNKRVALTLLCFIGLGTISFAVNLIGIRIAGDVESWMAWLKAHASIFLVWRLCLYAVVGYGWIWMRRRILQREANTEAKKRFVRIEASTVCALVLLEICNWFA